MISQVFLAWTFFNFLAYCVTWQLEFFLCHSHYFTFIFVVSTGIRHDLRRHHYVTNRFVWTRYEKYFPTWNRKPQSLAFWCIDLYTNHEKPLLKLKKPKTTTTTQYRRSGWWLSNQWYKILYLKQERTKHAIFIKN